MGIDLIHGLIKDSVVLYDLLVNHCAQLADHTLPNGNILDIGQMGLPTAAFEFGIN